MTRTGVRVRNRIYYQLMRHAPGWIDAFLWRVDWRYREWWGPR